MSSENDVERTATDAPPVDGPPARPPRTSWKAGDDLGGHLLPAFIAGRVDACPGFPYLLSSNGTAHRAGGRGEWRLAAAAQRGWILVARATDINIAAAGRRRRLLRDDVCAGKMKSTCVENETSERTGKQQAHPERVDLVHGFRSHGTSGCAWGGKRRMTIFPYALTLTI